MDGPSSITKLFQKILDFLLFKCTLSFLKSSLKFFFFLLKTSTLFIKIMDGPSSITKLFQKILDFISKILIFTLDNVKLFNCLILGSLQAVKFRAIVTSLIL